MKNRDQMSGIRNQKNQHGARSDPILNTGQMDNPGRIMLEVRW
jgi:hypothetical protein